MTQRHRRRAPTPRRERGYAMQGDGFYVWDEDPSEARTAGEALHRVLEWRSGRPGGAGGSGAPAPPEPAA